MEKKINNEEISRWVRSVEHQVPEKVEKNLRSRIQESIYLKKQKMKKRILWYPVSAFSLVLIALALVIPSFQPKNKNGLLITEIRTDLEIQNKNIKIIWIQKKDFNLRRNKK